MLQIAFLNISIMSMTKFVLSRVTRNAACQFPRNKIHHYALDPILGKVVGLKIYLILCKIFRPTFQNNFGERAASEGGIYQNNWKFDKIIATEKEPRLQD